MRVTVTAALALGALLLGATQTEVPDAPVTFVSVDELKSMLDRHTNVDIIDVRRHEAYLQQHIKGARSIPLQTFPDGARAIRKTGLVVFYWTCPHALARGASNILYHMGWRNHRVLYEGLPGWVSKRYAVEGTAPEIEPQH